VYRNTVIAAVSLCALVACSEDSTPPPPPGNVAPVFSSAATANAAEDNAGIVYTAAADDADGDPVTFSIAGGADESLFTITADGALSFDQAPNFERPRDAGRDNVYDVTIRASDSFAQTVDLALELTVTDLDNEPYQLTRVATGLDAPLFLIGRPGEDDIFVAEREGVIRLLDPATGTVRSSPFLDISADVGTAGEGGLLGLAPAPDYATSGVFFVHITNTSGDTEIRRYERFPFAQDTADPASEELILTVTQPADNHNGGWIGFGADDLLYIALGDGGGSGDPFDNGQDRDTLLGAILRIDPTTDAFPTNPDRNYAIPASNPFASSSGADEIWAYGLRNPYRSSFDRDTGDLYIGDVGQGDIEEIDLIPDGDNSGLNFGWPRREGTQREQGSDSASFTNPIAEYAHGTGSRQGNSINGGYVYRGPIAALEGRYFFSDFISDNVWSIPSSEFDQGDTISSDDFILETDVLTPDAGSLTSMVGFGEDNDGNLYILTIGGDIFRIDPA
jgi:glucose/arabinose dehydrogenase